MQLYVKKEESLLTVLGKRHEKEKKKISAHGNSMAVWHNSEQTAGNTNK